MVREEWSFHSDIAITLEGYARLKFGYNCRPLDTIFDADAIEQGSFVEDMIIMLRTKNNYRNDGDDEEAVEQFIIDCSPYLGKRGSNIDKEVAQGLFYRFKELYKG